MNNPRDPILNRNRRRGRPTGEGRLAPFESEIVEMALAGKSTRDIVGALAERGLVLPVKPVDTKGKPRTESACRRVRQSLVAMFLSRHPKTARKPSVVEHKNAQGAGGISIKSKGN